MYGDLHPPATNACAFTNGAYRALLETIYPLLDGKGRIGCLLIAALLEDWSLLAGTFSVPVRSVQGD